MMFGSLIIEGLNLLDKTVINKDFGIILLMNLLNTIFQK